MDREGFRNRLKQYKKAREENPGLKYWEWRNAVSTEENPIYYSELEDLNNQLSEIEPLLNERKNIEQALINKRLELSEKHKVPYLKDKEITLTNAGSMTGARLTTNLLDSIAKYANKTGLSLLEAVGLAALETTFGQNIRLFNKIHNNSNYDDYYVEDILSDWRYKSRDVNEYLEKKLNTPSAEAARLRKESFDYTMSKTNRMSAEEYEKSLILNKRELLLQAKDLIDFITNNYNDFEKAWSDYETKTVSPFEHAFQYYKTGKYNPGDPTHTDMVKLKGAEVTQSPEFKNWFKNVPKYDEGTGFVGMPSTTSADGRTKYVYYDPTMDLEYQNIHLPEVTVTGNKNAGKRLPMQVPEGSYERFKTLGEIGKTVGGFLPVAGEMIDTHDLVTDIKNKDWTNTAIRVGGYLMPNILEKGLSFGKNIYNAYKISKRIDNATSGLVKNKQQHLPSYTLYLEPTRLLMLSVYDDELNKFAKASVNDIKKFYWSDDYRKRLDNAYSITGDKRFDNNFIPSQMVSTLDNVLVTADNEMKSLGITGWDKISNRPTIRINKDIHYKNGYSIRETMDHEVAHASGKGTASKIHVNDFNKSIINLKPATEIASEFNVQNFDELTKYMNHEMYDTDVEELRSRAYSVLLNAKWLGKEIDDYVDDAPMKDDQLEDLLRVMPKESVKHFVKNFLSGAGIVYTGANTFKNKSIENHQNK